MSAGKSEGLHLLVAVFGLGEAGSLIARDLARLGVRVNGYDPASVTTPDGVTRVHDPVTASSKADYVIALTASADARQAMDQAASHIRPATVYADFSTASVDTKKHLADRAASLGFLFVDVALLGMVPGNGLYTPSIAAGTGARQFCDVFSRLGMRVDYVGESAGEAAARKLLRSIFMKGVAAVSIEALVAAKHFQLERWLWNNMASELESAHEAWLRRLVKGTELHATRRLAEMEAAAALIRSVGEVPLLTDGTVANLKSVEKSGLPFDEDAFGGEDR